MIINERNIKTWSLIGQRATFGLVALEVVKKTENLIILTSDVSTSAGLERFRKTYPNNFIDVGIAEQNLIGIAAGLASEKFKVITTSFSPFQVLRCCEQIKVNLGYMKHNVIMVGLASGLTLGALGFTHASIEDIGVLRSIPNLNLICPSDSGEVVKALDASLKNKNSSYIRLTGASNNVIINEDDYDFEIGKSIQIKEGYDVCIISNGQIISECLIAAKKLDENKISTSVVNMHTIKPIDKIKLREIAQKFSLIITVEEHNILGGLGSAIAEEIVQIKNSPPQIFIGIEDYYEKGGNYLYLKDKYGINSEKIFTKVINSYEEYRKI